MNDEIPDFSPEVDQPFIWTEKHESIWDDSTSPAKVNSFHESSITTKWRVADKSKKIECEEKKNQAHELAQDTAPKSNFMPADEEHDKEESEYDCSQASIYEPFKASKQSKTEEKPRRHWQSEPRWGRAEDKNLYRVLRELEANGTLTLEEILQTSTRHNIYNNKGIHELMRLSEWKGHAKNIVRRIQRLSKPQSLSAREMKLFKRLYKKQKVDGTPNYEEMLYEFPGKTIDILQEAGELYLSSKKCPSCNAS